MVGLISELESREDSFIVEFSSHGVFAKRFSKIEEIKPILLQRRFLSFEFVKTYDFLIDALEDSYAISVARQIVREEYPVANGSFPSHREDLLRDLNVLSFSKEEVFSTVMTFETRRTIERNLENIFKILNDRHREVMAIAYMRFFGEVLTSIEYEMFGDMWLNRVFNFDRRRGKSYLLKSHFYYNHFRHDRKMMPLDAPEVANGGSHSDRLAGTLVRLVSSRERLEAVVEAERLGLETKSKFYDQFF
jgi:hypothetical protein